MKLGFVVGILCFLIFIGCIIGVMRSDTYKHERDMAEIGYCQVDVDRGSGVVLGWIKCPQEVK